MDLDIQRLARFEHDIQRLAAKLRVSFNIRLHADWDDTTIIINQLATIVNDLCGVLGEFQVFTYRQSFVQLLSWSIFDQATIEFIAQQITEAAVGAISVHDLASGRGLFAALLDRYFRRKGVAATVMASDKQDGVFLSESTRKYYAVQAFDSVSAVKELPAKVFCLFWPEYLGSWAVRALRAIHEDATHDTRFVYCGESEGMCCADVDFFRALDTNWRVVAEHDCPRWSGIYDRVTVYAPKLFCFHCEGVCYCASAARQVSRAPSAPSKHFVKSGM